MPELWDQLEQQPVAEPPSLWPQGDRAPLRITVGGPTMKDGAQASSGSSLDPFNPPQVEYVGKPLARGLAGAGMSVLEKGRNLMQGLMDAEAERTGQAPSVSTDYDPRQRAVENMQPLLANLWGVGSASVPRGAVGAVGGQLAPALMAAEAPAAAPAFYSALIRSIEGAKLNKASPEQWLGYLRNQPGVKAEEIDRVLGNLPKEGMFTKPDVQAHAAENAVTLGEVNKGGADYAKTDALEAERRSVRSDLDKARELFAMDPGSRVAATARVRELADRDQALTDQIVAAQGVPTQYSQWQLPGGENYREKLLTLPEKTTRLDEINNRLDEISKMRASQHAEHPELRDEFDKLNAERRPLMQDLPQPFRSSHWDEPNVLAHIRMNDREVPGVGKSLHLEEIQSDWHQKGRQQGYQQKVGPDDVRLKRIEGNPPEGADPSNYPGYWESFDQNGNMISRHRGNATEAEARAEAVRANEVDNRSARVPDAPFKTTWPDVALKRSIRDAAEGGYDALSWTPGEAQAARYDLSKHISDVELHGTGDNLRLSAFDKNGRVVVDMQHTTRQGLADHIGKEAAEKLLAQAEPDLQKNPYGARRLANADLKVGGEGMKAFYDKMLVDKANALGKKHGARVEQQSIDRPYVDQFGKTKQEQAQPIHVLRITPQLREAAMKGFPLFSALFGATAAAPSLWPQEGRQ